MRELPTGTVTFLFTDIEGSTRLLHELGDDYADVLAEHRGLLREAFVRHNGVEVDTQGDAFFVAFAGAKDALAAAAEGQQALTKASIRVRMGLHTGEPVVTEEGYVGVDVHKGARIAAAGHGGQVLVSQTTRDLVGGDGLHDLGEHRLKDLTAPIRLYQLGSVEFPPLKTLFGTNLPVQPTPLVGRERELEEAACLLRDHRVLTLLGPGGSGKTRLGLQIAADALEEFPDGVFWVPLQAVADPALVEPAMGQALGSANGLVGHVGDKRLLLLADNFEHVLEAAAGIAELVAGTPHAKLLVTSREPLRIAGEQRYPVDPLPENDAVALFVERARAVEPAFVSDDTVHEICRRLDGLPLAIELAAARVSMLDNATLAARLEQRLSLLTGGARDVPERQRTLRATIEWSHDLLDPAEQEAFRRLGVFAGSFELKAAEAVGEVSFDTVASLVEKNLVRRWGSGRFGMLDTIHEYARERLRVAGEEREVRRRHAEFFLALAESAHLVVETIELGQNHELVRPESDNLRAALDWSVDHDPVLGLQLVVALEQFWVAIGPHEGIDRLEELFAAAGDVPPGLHARAVRVLGGMYYITGQFDRGTELSEESLEEFRELGDELGIGHMLHRIANEALRVGDYARARALTAESGEISRRHGSKMGDALNASNLARVEWAEGNRELALELIRRSAAGAAEVGFIWWQVGSLYVLVEWSFELGNADDSVRYGREALELAHEIGDRLHRIYLLALLARAAAEAGDTERAGLIWGVVEAEERRGPIGQWEDERASYAEPVLASAGPGFEAAAKRGRQLSLDEAVAFALSVD
ncbi:MAG: adenylate/guanylate cyclase domain-containing protein [Actinomycetota bacterium]|nr:adenylate/guanylate cyclase domain-containing protein [Actinomycetota bacterium]